MDWVIPTLLVYVLIGALIVVRCTRNMILTATLGEWIVMILLWPVCLRFFAHLEMLHSTMKALEGWASSEDQNSVT